MNALKHLMFAVAGFGLIASGQIAMAQETPTTAPAGVHLVEAAAVQALQGKGALVVDTRRASEYAEGTIKGAINVPYDPEKSAKDVGFDPAQDKFDLAKFADKNKDIVIVLQLRHLLEVLQGCRGPGQERLQERALVSQRLPGLEGPQAADGISSAVRRLTNQGPP